MNHPQLANCASTGTEVPDAARRQLLIFGVSSCGTLAAGKAAAAIQTLVPTIAPTYQVGEVMVRMLNLECVLGFATTHDLYVPYQRYQRLLVLSGTTAKVKILALNLGSGQGGKITFQGPSYHLLCDGVRVATVSVPAGSYVATFTVDATQIAQGWHLLDIEGGVNGETPQPLWAFVKHDARVGEQPFTPVMRGQYERATAATTKTLEVWAKAPGRYAPVAKPLTTRRAYQALPSTLLRRDLNCEFLIPMRWGDMHRPNINRDGLLSSFDCQSYAWSGLIAKYPGSAQLDGPRGVGTASYITHLEIGVAAPGGIPRNNTYFCDPWRVGKISEDGHITTLVGYRHKGNVLSHFEDADPNTLELVGDWSAVPATRRGFHEMWGMAWDPRTLGINEQAAPIPSENDERPHVTGPVMFVADSQNGRICRIEFSATAHGVPPKVTEFVTGLGDPWDIVYADGVLYVTERQLHRIVAFDATTGSRLRVVVQGSPLAFVDPNREVRVVAPMEMLQAAPCVLPEGLYFQDGWLYFASKAQAQVRRVRVDGSGLQVVRPIHIDGNSKFAKLALSDGTFGPRGSTFTWTWSNANFGGPEMYDPAGKPITTWWNLQSGGTGDWSTHAGYATAGAVGQGRLLTATMLEGLKRITKAQPGDRVETLAVTAGRQEYYAAFLHLLHGPDGYGFYGQPLPWGHSPNVDAYLQFCGHTPS